MCLKFQNLILYWISPLVFFYWYYICCLLMIILTLTPLLLNWVLSSWVILELIVCLVCVCVWSFISRRKPFPVRSVSLEAFEVLWQTPNSSGSTGVSMCKEGTVIIFPSKVITEWYLVACAGSDVRGMSSDFKLMFAGTVLCSKIGNTYQSAGHPRSPLESLEWTKASSERSHPGQTPSPNNLPFIKIHLTWDGYLQYRCLHLSKSPQDLFTEPSSGHDLADKR